MLINRHLECIFFSLLSVRLRGSVIQQQALMVTGCKDRMQVTGETVK
jgi:hypothetical protein